jgi:hypothetical protein
MEFRSFFVPPDDNHRIHAIHGNHGGTGMSSSCNISPPQAASPPMDHFLPPLTNLHLTWISPLASLLNNRKRRNNLELRRHDLLELKRARGSIKWMIPGEPGPVAGHRKTGTSYTIMSRRFRRPLRGNTWPAGRASPETQTTLQSSGEITTRRPYSRNGRKTKKQKRLRRSRVRITQTRSSVRIPKVQLPRRQPHEVARIKESPQAW